MKFAKELEQDLVPEWRVKYLDYRAGKKRVKVVSRAIARANASPRTPAAASQNLISRFPSRYGATSPFATRQRPSPARVGDIGIDNEGPADPLRASPAPMAEDTRPNSYSSVQAANQTTPPMPIIRKSEPADSLNAMYGSFVPTPPARDRAGTLVLPDPAVDPEDSTLSIPRPTQESNTHADNYDGVAETLRAAQRRASDGTHDAYQVGLSNSPATKSRFASLRARIPHHDGKPLFRRLFSVGSPHSQASTRRQDVDMVVIDQVRMRQREFFAWMDRELAKVESFYKMKEDEAGARLQILRDQLHEMRNRRIEEVAEMERAKHHHKPADESKSDDERPNSRDRLNGWFDPIERVVGDAAAKTRAKINRPGANTKALQGMAISPDLKGRHQDEGRDYVRRRHHGESVPYRTAKRKLKTALQEFYRSMELLKSYALLNRVAFRKINKKYDKATDARPALRYMSEKVNKSWFVQSDVLDSHMHAVEDLYARYFERGNRKIATGKLRSSTSKNPDQSASAFRNGMLIGIGAVFAIQGIIYGSELLHHSDPTVVLQTSYLLQIYGGYFLGLYLFSWFCFDCSIWSRNKINYQFVFEYDPRHNLDWRQLSEFPSFLILLLGLFLWLNFTRYGADEMYIYYPVILVGLTIALIFLPGRIFYYRSRKWFAYSLWRLFWAGLYPVEFRDFFLGDMFCSLTYLTSNVELFFCLYANHWNNPSQCNSTHSRLLGFFSTLPSIWRAFQCLRRYYDTRNIFPHLVNCGKYAMSILYYTTLSMYRINQTKHHLAVFLVFAVINAIYSSIWDILMDWSLLQPDAKKRFLRDVRGYKNPMYYYGAMVLDPILRFNWIFYPLFTGDVQHSTIVSFLVAFSEVTRRGIWVIFRVENEHCANVAHFKASRDVPLPYELPCEIQSEAEEAEAESQVEGTTTGHQPSPAVSRLRSHTGATLEAQTSSSGSTLRHRRSPGSFNPPSLQRAFTKIVADAHTQDFEKKRKPGMGKESNSKEKGKAAEDGELNPEADDGSASSSDSDDEQNLRDAHALLRQRTEAASEGEARC